ncbi:MAG: winged helix-turn-helix domain-containing protein [Candidatus Dormibacteria bacterium]
MTFLAAAKTVLKAANHPLTTGELTALALEQGLITTKGKTPEHTMAAKLYTAIRDDPECPIHRTYKRRGSSVGWGSVRWVWKGRRNQAQRGRADLAKRAPRTRLRPAT